MVFNTKNQTWVHLSLVKSSNTTNSGEEFSCMMIVM